LANSSHQIFCKLGAVNAPNIISSKDGHR